MHRMELHDKIGYLAVCVALEEKGYAVERTGMERYSDETIDKLSQNSDSTSTFLRWHPDIAAIGNGKSHLCEVKTVDVTRRDTGNWAIEADSYKAAKMFVIPVIYIFVDVVNGQAISIKWCQSDDITPSVITIPDRFNFEQKRDELKIYFSDGVRFEPRPHNGGSGTPYFLIPKRSDYIKGWNSFC